MFVVLLRRMTTISGAAIDAGPCGNAIVHLGKLYICGFMIIIVCVYELCE